jgi:hypothetical protein
MKARAVREKRAAHVHRKTPYVHKPMGPEQQVQKAAIRNIIGNTEVQAKPLIGQPGDRYEQEADRVADMVLARSHSSPVSEGTRPGHANVAAKQQVATSPAHASSKSPPAITPLVQPQLNETKEEESEESVQAKLLQRQPREEEGEETVQMKRIQRQAENENEEDGVQATLLVQRQAENDDEQENIQAKPSRKNNLLNARSHIAAQAIQNKSSGAPIRSEVRQTLEHGMEQDLSGVRVHESSSDRSSASNIGARAFTYKNHIWLGRGESQSDIHLMAHETTHVLQQGGVVRRQPSTLSRVAPRVQGGWWEDIKSAGSKVVAAGKSVVSKAGEAIGGAKDWVLKKVAGLANNIPGFHLLTVILGKNPITDKPVQRNAVNIIRGVMGLIPGGNALFENLQKAGVIERAAKWFNLQIELLNLTWAGIKALFRQAWASLSAADLLSPSRAFAKIKIIFLPPLVRIKNFAVAAGKMVLRFIFEGALSLAGKAGKRVMAILQRGKSVLGLIVKNPVGFLGNLLKAVGRGFRQFSANIWKHLKAGIFGWLFGTLTKAGIQIPHKFDLKGIVSLVLQILGLTYANLRVKLVKRIGEKPVSYLETGFEFLKLLVTKGLAGAWQKIIEYMGSLKEIVVGAVKEWVVTKIVTSAITKLASMFNPVGAIIQAIITIYNTVMFFIERAKQIMALANAVFQSVASIALGKIKAAADYVELTMARTIPVIISFLARLLGLGGIADKIMGVIRKIQAKVNMALDKLVGFVVTKAKKIIGKGVKTKQEGKIEKENLDDLNAAPVTLPRSKTEEKEHLAAAARGATTLSKKSDVKSNKDLEPYFAKLKKRYKLTKIGFKTVGPGNLKLYMAINPDTELDVHERMEGTGLDGIKTSVKWETASLGGVTVGKRMQADMLGPDHIQGTPPGSGVQQGLMDKLVTDTSEPGDSKYIRGHLLNDNVGGKGEGFNLYPITGSANKKHHDSIEQKVKHWVNNEKYWVSYKVDVDQKSTDLSHGPKSSDNYVNSILRCRAAIKGTDGKEYDSVTSNISSTFQAPASADVKETESAQKPKVSAEAKAMEAKLSTSKSARSYVFHGALYAAMQSQRNNVAAAVPKVKGLGSGAWSSLQQFFLLTNGNKNKDLRASLATSTEKRMFSLLMANADKILNKL